MSRTPIRRRKHRARSGAEGLDEVPMSGFAASDLTVVIPTRERWPILRRTLDALRDQTVSGFDIVVVVDGTDQSPPPMPDAAVIVKEHGGPGAARNAGVARTGRPLILFLGDDMVPEPSLIEHHLALHSREPAPEVAVLGHVDWHPDVADDRILRWFDWSSSQFDYRTIEGREAGWGRFYSSNVSLKREFFSAVGGFDEDFVFYYEDLDCGRRLHERGLRLLYEPNARALHLHHYTMAAVLGRFEGIARGEHVMTHKHPWFTPFFGERVKGARSRPRASSLWPRIVDAVPEGNRFRRLAERRANDWYYQQIAPRFEGAWHGARDLEELKAFLGASFDEGLLRGHSAAVDREEHDAPDEETFYRTSRMYLYDLTVFAMSGTKEPYLADLARVVPQGSRLIDWGCGIGSDGLRLIERGYRVAFADFDNPSVAYLRWRLARRGVEADVYDVEHPDRIPRHFDAAYSFDVIEHVDDPFAFLAELERHAHVVAVNLLEPVKGDTHLHKPLPIPELLDYARSRGIIRYRRYHGRSHLVIYRSRSGSVLQRLMSRAELAGGRLIAAVRTRPDN